MGTPTIPNGERIFLSDNFYEGNGIGSDGSVSSYPLPDNGTIANSCLFNNYDTSNVGH